MSKTVRRVPFILPLLAALVLAAVLVDPRGDFPLNDDWVYLKAVESLLETGQYTGHPYTAVTLMAHAYWGAAVSKVFGFGFTALRIAELALALIGAWAAARCAWDYGAAWGAALLCGMLVLFNPVYFNQSFTFMTDVPACAWITLAGLFYLKAFRENRAWPVAVGTVFGVLAFFTRQHGVFILGAFVATPVAMWVLWKRRLNWKMIGAFAAVLPVAAVLFLYMQANKEAGTIQDSWMARIFGLPIHHKIAFSIRYALLVSTYVGLILLPAAAARVLGVLKGEDRWTAIRWLATFGLAAMIAIGTSIWPHPTRLPSLPNVMHDTGLGPITLGVADGTAASSTPFALDLLWWAITAAATLSAAVLIVDILLRLAVPLIPWPGKRRDPDLAPPRAAETMFLLAWGVVYVASYMPFHPGTFDRYTIMTVVPWTILAAGFWTRDGEGRRLRGLSMAAATGLAGLIAVYAIAGTRDYMDWNRTAHDTAVRLVEERGADPLEIDAGYEYTGWMASDAYMERHETRDYQDRGPHGNWLEQNTYVLSFVPRDAFTETERVDYFSWLALGKREILVLRNDNAP
ncbi:MAG: hypothetical protein GY851_20865 [bacterium]|nr:hypothetical protein [bacterium]